MAEDKKTKELKDKITELENRVRKLESVFILGSSILSGPATENYNPFSGEDPLLDRAAKEVRQYDRASASLLQRRLAIGYARAARLIDLLEKNGVLGRSDGSAAREVLQKAEVKK